eukprot:3941470-Rhodomonas_salina.1
MDVEDISPCFESYVDVGPGRCTFECLAVGLYVDVVGSTATAYARVPSLEFLNGEVQCKCDPITMSVDGEALSLNGRHPGQREVRVLGFGRDERVGSDGGRR